MKIYISGKISGLDPSQAFELFGDAERQLRSLGFDPVNPMRKVSEQEGKTWKRYTLEDIGKTWKEYMLEDIGKTWKEYMLEDIAILWDCAAIYMLPNWTDSKGAGVELAIAKALNIPVIFQPEEHKCQ